MQHVQSSIAPGGCVWPPAWPPGVPDLPDEKSEYGREFLREDFDWMSVPHPMLYRMVRDGLDLGSVVDAAARWGTFGEDLEAIGQDLRRSLEDSAHGWQGEAAEQARTTMRRLAHWTEQTSQRGNEISACIARQADLAEHAKHRMPEPVLDSDPKPLPMPLPVPADSGGTAAMSASSFTTGGFADAAFLSRDAAPRIEEAAQRHREAARVMRQLQHDSFDVYRDIPRFTSPDGRRGKRDRDEHRRRRDGGDGDGEEAREGRRHDAGRDDSGTSSAGSGAVPSTPAAPPPPGAPGVAPTSGPRAPSGGFVSGGAVPTPSPGASSGELAAGRRAGVAMPSTPSGSTVSSSGVPAAGTSTSRGFAGGAMPVGAAGAGSRLGGDTEHTVAEYLEEDSDFWSPGGPVVPPVIGEDPPREYER